MPTRSPYVFHPATPDRWDDLETLFGPRGACGGCWCMVWRLPRSRYVEGKGAGNRRALRALVSKGKAPGILAYAGKEPVGWCAVAPREEYPALERSRVLKRVDEKPVWSVSCFFVRRDHRNRGLTTGLLIAAARFAAEHGARIIEGYPTDLRPGEEMPGAWAWTGFAPAFVKAGFREVERRSPKRPIMRRVLRSR